LKGTEWPNIYAGVPLRNYSLSAAARNSLFVLGVKSPLVSVRTVRLSRTAPLHMCCESVSFFTAHQHIDRSVPVDRTSDTRQWLCSY